MSEVGALIADLVAAGVSGDLIGRVAAAIAEASSPPQKSARSAANARYYEARKRRAPTPPPTESDTENDLNKILKPTENVLIQYPLTRVRDNLPLLEVTGKKDKSSLRSDKAKGAVTPSRRCPEDFEPSVAVLATGESEGLSWGQIERELAKFRDHEFRSPRKDWDAAFRNWLRTAAEQHGGTNGRLSPAKEKQNERLTNINRGLSTPARRIVQTG